MNTYILPIHPEYAAAIYSGKKKYEIRKRIPNFTEGDRIYLYETTPVRRVTGYFEMDSIVWGSPQWLWEQYHKKICIDYLDYCNYVGSKKIVYYVHCNKPKRLHHPLPLSLFGLTYTPQSWVRLQSSLDRDIDKVLDYLFSRP